MADGPDHIKELTDALNGKGVRGACPMCHRNAWMTENDTAYSRVEVTDTASYDLRSFKGFFPSYWLYCGNCGFVAQFMKSVVDGEPNPEPESPPNERQ